MTTKPELRSPSELVPALAAVGLFVVMVAVFVGAPIGPAEGIPANTETVNESLGDASLESNASINTTSDGQTIAMVKRPGGTENTTLANETGVNASLVVSGGELYAVVHEPLSVTESIGYAMFGMTDQMAGEVQSENFLAVFEMIDLVLVAALVGAVVLARREEAGQIVSLFSSSEDASPSGAVAADGGREDDDGGDA